MSPSTQGAIVLVVTLIILLSGTPVAFGLGALSIAFIVMFQGFGALHVVAETFFHGLNDFTLVSIPMFVMMGAAIGSSPAGKDLYEALDRWLYRLPGGLVISNLGACAVFAALTGSSPACCAAIGKMGIPEMRRRGYPDDIATGSICAGGTLGILIPPSITFILYGIATETSIGRLFLAGVLPGLMLTGLFILWTLFIIWKKGFRAHAPDFRYSWKEKFGAVPKVAPFLAINLLLLVCGFFIPPAAIILMTAPILYPIIKAAGFDPVWFGVILTINMEIGLIHPPVGLNIYIVKSIAPDVPVARIMWGTLPYVGCMMLAIVILSFFPDIATWLPDTLMGAAKR